MLEEIRSTFIKNGLNWSVQPEKKLTYLWTRNVHNEEELQKALKGVSKYVKYHDLHLGEIHNLCFHPIVSGDCTS